MEITNSEDDEKEEAPPPPPPPPPQQQETKKKTWARVMPNKKRKRKFVKRIRDRKGSSQKKSAFNFPAYWERRRAEATAAPAAAAAAPAKAKAEIDTRTNKKRKEQLFEKENRKMKRGMIKMEETISQNLEEKKRILQECDQNVIAIREECKQSAYTKFDPDRILNRERPIRI